MSKRKRRHGDRFRLILYRRMIGRHRWTVFLIAITFFGSWYLINSQQLHWVPPVSPDLLLIAGAITLCYWIFTLLGPLLAYTQARETHLRLQTPFYRLTIPYRHIRSVRPVEIRKAFSPSSLNGLQRRFLGPFFNRTAVAVDLQDLPRPSPMLRLYFHKFLFAPDSPGFVLLVDNWIALSHQLSNRIDAWRMQHSRSPRSGASDAAQILMDPQEGEDHRKWRY